MDHPAEQPSFQTEPAGHVEPGAPQASLDFEFSSGGLLVLRGPDVLPLRQAKRSNATSQPLLEALLMTMDGEPRDLNSSAAWVPKDELLRRAVNPASADPNSSFKKALAAARRKLGLSGCGSIEASHTGLYRFVPPYGTTVAARLRD